MHSCCPPGHGCNSAGDSEPCALVLCRLFASVEPDAALAITRWTAVEKTQQRPGEGGREPRFRRRAYERVRDRARGDRDALCAAHCSAGGRQTPEALIAASTCDAEIAPCPAPGRTGEGRVRPCRRCNLICAAPQIGLAPLTLRTDVQGVQASGRSDGRRRL